MFPIRNPYGFEHVEIEISDRAIEWGCGDLGSSLILLRVRSANGISVNFLLQKKTTEQHLLNFDIFKALETFLSSLMEFFMNFFKFPLRTANKRDIQSIASIKQNHIMHYVVTANILSKTYWD